MRARAPILANFFLLFVSFGVITPYLPLYLKARGFAPSRIGLLLGFFEIAGVAGPIIIGHLADRRSAYRALLAAGSFVPILLFVPLQLTTLLAVYVPCLLAIGFTWRSTIPLLDSLVSRTLTDPSLQYGRLRVSGSLGFIAASLFLQLTDLVSSDSSISMLIAFIVSAACAGLAAVALPAAPKATHGPDDPMSARSFDGRFWAVIGVIFLARFGIAAHYSFFSLYLRETFGLPRVSGVWAIGPVAEIPTIFFSGLLLARAGIRRLLLVSLAAVSLRLVLYGVVPSLPVVAFAQLLHAFTFGTLHAASVAFINQSIGPGRRGLGMAIYNAVGIGVPGFIASAFGGFLIESSGFPTLFLSYAAAPLLGIAVLVVFGRRGGRNGQGARGERCRA